MGAALFGEYVYIAMVVTVLGVFAPLGVDFAVVMFGARFIRSGERGRLRGLLRSSAAVVAISGSSVAVGLFAAARWGWLAQRPEAHGLQVAAAAVAFLAPLYVAVGALRAAKDMKGSSIAMHGVLPLSLLVGAIGVAIAGGGLTGFLISFVVAHGLALFAAGGYAWRRHGALIIDTTTASVTNLRELLSYAVPQGFAFLTQRVAQWADILMLTWLATSEQVGLYRVAAALAVIGNLPMTGISAMFNPMVAEQVHAGELTRLNALLQMVTRGLLTIALPCYLLLFLVPELALMPFDEVYLASAAPLMILVGGQVINTACAPAMNLIPMAGYARLNLVNALVAGTLNIVLNALLIPRYGAEGAATATALTLAAWSLWRVVEIRLLLRCFPWSWRSLVPMGAMITLGLATKFVLRDAAVGWRLAAAVALVGGFAYLVWRLRTPEDGIFWERIRTLLRRRLPSIR